MKNLIYSNPVVAGRATKIKDAVGQQCPIRVVDSDHWEHRYPNSAGCNTSKFPELEDAGLAIESPTLSLDNSDKMEYKK